jgi:hypothetical protein
MTALTVRVCRVPAGDGQAQGDSGGCLGYTISPSNAVQEDTIMSTFHLNHARRIVNDMWRDEKDVAAPMNSYSFEDH